MTRSAPTIKELGPRDMVSRAIYFEIKEGRGAGPNKDYVYLHVDHLDPKVVEEKLPDITEFARIYLNVEPLKEGVPIQPTAHYAMGGIPTNVEAQDRDAFFQRLEDRKSTRLNSSHTVISYAVFCLKKKNK